MWLGPKFSTSPMPFLIVTPESRMCEQLVLVFNVRSAFCYALNIHYQTSGCRSVNSSEACGKPRPIPEIKSSSKKDWRSHGLSYCIVHSNQQTFLWRTVSMHFGLAQAELGLLSCVQSDHRLLLPSNREQSLEHKEKKEVPLIWTLTGMS